MQLLPWNRFGGIGSEDDDVDTFEGILGSLHLTATTRYCFRLAAFLAAAVSRKSKVSEMIRTVLCVNSTVTGAFECRVRLCIDSLVVGSLTTHI